MKKKIYISGKITGTEDYLSRFAEAEELLNNIGYEGAVFNPAKVSAGLPLETTSYRDYIHIGLLMLDACEAIFMLSGWQDSPGASLELHYAATLGYKIIFEEELKGGNQNG